MEDIILVGFGGHAKSVADCIVRNNQYRIAGYTDVTERKSEYRYLGTDDELSALFNKGICNAVICIGYLGKGNVRERIFEKLKSIGFTLPVIIDPSAIISESATIGEGTFIGKGAAINAEASVGKCCIINTKAVIEHECHLEDFVHVAVGAVLCGQVSVGKSAFIGANSTVIQQKSVGEKMIVPAGAVIR